MAEYYLISQLPSLDGAWENNPLPITDERFLELCSRILGGKELEELENLTIVPPIDANNTNSALIEAWCDGERDLRLALSKVRADKMNKPINLGNKNLSSEIVKVANSALEMNPLEAEIFLLNHRLNFLESIRPLDGFSTEFLFYYGLKLKLILRLKKFDANIGETTYKDIYNSILNGENLEA